MHIKLSDTRLIHINGEMLVSAMSDTKVVVCGSKGGSFGYTNYCQVVQLKDGKLETGGVVAVDGVNPAVEKLFGPVRSRVATSKAKKTLDIESKTVYLNETLEATIKEQHQIDIPIITHHLFLYQFKIYQDIPIVMLVGV